MAVGGESCEPINILASKHHQHEGHIQNIDEKGPNLQRGPNEEHRRADKLSGKENAPGPRHTARVNIELVRQWAANVDSSARERCLAACRQRPAEAKQQGRVGECMRDAGRGSKTSIVFWGAGAGRSGWLVRCLDEFAEREINLTRIESRPMRERLGQYMFFVDLEGSLADASVAGALGGLRALCERVRVLGSYPNA